MELRIDRLSKRYATHWVFRDVSLTLPSYGRLSVTGPNGSGKSTFLKIVAGMLTPSAGEVRYTLGDQRVSVEAVPRMVALASPYSEMIEEMTLAEALRFHTRFRVMYEDVRAMDRFLEILDYPFRTDHQIRYMSSGMKQRLRLAFALCTDTPLLALDEPTSNLDEEGVEWFHRMLTTYSERRTVLIASNVPADLVSCTIQQNFGGH